MLNNYTESRIKATGKKDFSSVYNNLIIHIPIIYNTIDKYLYETSIVKYILKYL